MPGDPFHGRTADRSHQQVADTVLKDGIGLETDRVSVALCLQKLIDVRGGEGGITPEAASQVPFPVTLNDRLQNAAPTIGAVDVAGTQGTAFQIAELIEHEQRVVAGALVMAVPDAHLLLAVGRAHA